MDVRALNRFRDISNYSLYIRCCVTSNDLETSFDYNKILDVAGQT